MLCRRSLQDHICSHCVCDDVRGGCAVGIHQLEMAAGLRNGFWLRVWMALEPDAGVCLRASALCKLGTAIQQPDCNDYAAAGVPNCLLSHRWSYMQEFYHS